MWGWWAWWVWWGVWSSLAATGEPVDGFRIRLHEAEQKVLFKGEAVGGTVREGVAGWGFSGCRCTG